MSLPDSYTQKPSAISEYFESFKAAQAPERVSYKFLENLGFTSTNDRMIIGILKELGFIDTDGKPTQRYYKFLDKNESSKIIAEGIRDAYSDLFAVNLRANELSIEDVKNKLRSLYAGKKTDQVIGRIATTFNSLCELGDFSIETVPKQECKVDNTTETSNIRTERPLPNTQEKKEIALGSLQYHINIILPATKDQAVYDAIFKSLKEHLG
ncbi:DUF5343 domain-containing protein [Treponema vincentii]|jgi:uncharacterized protein AF_1681|uniref:DUF5343 domain-containing protein n=1 Tax=Treponema vincentii TaxID=69710 RepID=A0A6P1Y2M5_9SPIR|nr:DUF5343 domain-containing protein [Treponema vincentii]QHX43825.1 DUF5343 domain-containing protein [Treponema vincentii]